MSGDDIQSIVTTGPDSSYGSVRTKPTATSVGTIIKGSQGTVSVRTVGKKGNFSCDSTVTIIGNVGPVSAGCYAISGCTPETSEEASEEAPEEAPEEASVVPKPIPARHAHQGPNICVDSAAMRIVHGPDGKIVVEDNRGKTLVQRVEGGTVTTSFH